jgi:hypothetical protein
MEARRPRRIRLRRSKSKRRAQGSSKPYEAARREMSDNDESPQVEPTHNLLFSSLRYWEAERDLIEERTAGIRR